MPAISPEMKQRMVELTREAYDRGKAAEMIGDEFGVKVTGTQFKRMCNETSPTYDHEFATAYMEAVAQRDPILYARRQKGKADGGRTTTDQGHTRALHITEEDLDSFLDQVESGVPRDSAARAIGTSLVQIGHRANHDQDFAARLKHAYEVGYPAYQEWLRGQVVEFIKAGNYPALHNQMIVHLPEYDKVRTSKHEIGGLDGGSLKVFIDRVFHNLPKELQDQVIKAVEAGETPPELKALPGGA